MRVALVCPYDLVVPGGVQAHVVHLAAELRAAGDDVVVVAPGTGPSSSWNARVGSHLRVPFNDSVAPIALGPRVPSRVLGTLRRFGPDIVHVHEPAVPLVSLTATLRGPHPVVGTFHAWSDRGRLYRVARPVLRHAIAGFAARLAVSQPALRYHAHALGLAAGSFREVPNGVEVERFATVEPLPELTASGVPILLFVGRLEPRKGLETLLRAFVALKASRPSTRLLVVGEGAERERCQALLPARLRSDVLFLGRVDAEDLPRFYRSADVFVAPSLGGESFGVVLLEAMAAGRPVIASDIPGYRSVLRDGIDGHLVPPGDQRALTSAIETLLANPALRDAMGREAHAAALRYDWSVVVRQIREVYATALAAG